MTSKSILHDEELSLMLKEHYYLFYDVLAKMQFSPHSSFTTVKDIKRAFTGISMCFFNSVFNCPNDKSRWDDCIEQELHHFRKANMPFVWCIDENEDADFKQKLLDHGFQNGGIFRGMIGTLDQPIPEPTVPNGYTLELVKDKKALEDFTNLVCEIFGMEHVKDQIQVVLDEFTKRDNPKMLHWLARKDGKAVSTVSTLIEKDIVSFWNGASAAEIRKQGISTALRHLALKDAIARGCSFGASYLMSEGMALGICTKLGFEPKWRYNVFIAPQ